MRHYIFLFVRHTMETPWSLGFLSLILIVIPIIGMQLVHKYGWQHWAPFDRGHKQGYNKHIRDWNASWLTSPRVNRIGIQPAWERGGNPLELVSVILQDITDALFTGCSSTWQSAVFGRRMPQVQILSPRFLIHNDKMHFYSVEYWQKNWESMIERVEKGETIGVENEKGERAVMVPADDELIRIYTEHDEGS